MLAADTLHFWLLPDLDQMPRLRRQFGTFNDRDLTVVSYERQRVFSNHRNVLNYDKVKMSKNEFSSVFIRGVGAMSGGLQ